MATMIVAFLTFLTTHANLISAIWDALDAGATNEQILKGIRESMVAASDAAVEAQLGPRPPKKAVP